MRTILWPKSQGVTGWVGSLLWRFGRASMTSRALRRGLS